MENHVAQILELVPPPTKTVGTDFDWGDVQSHFQIEFPEDFRQLVSEYGRGLFLPSEVYLCNYLEDRCAGRNEFNSEFDQFGH